MCIVHCDERKAQKGGKGGQGGDDRGTEQFAFYESHDLLLLCEM